MTMLIQISRTVRLTLQDAELQALTIGEIYDVAPAIGQVLVNDGWAREVIAQSTLAWAGSDVANDDPCDAQTDS
jgi:hypothetical protein